MATRSAMGVSSSAPSALAARRQAPRRPLAAAAGQTALRRPLASLAGLALVVLGLVGYGAPAAFLLAGAARGSAGRSRAAAAEGAQRMLPAPLQASPEDQDGWYMMPLGIPKVAYRIPGAPNAEWVDIYNRLYRERIIFLGKEIDDRLANEIIGVLLYLDSEESNKPIYLYINSVGGSVIAGLAIYDTLQHIKSPVITINVGMAASMASFLLASGEKGKRIALPHSRVMIHQAMGGAQGQAEDIKVEAQQILTINSNIVKMYAKMTGKPEEVIKQDLMRDNYMSAEEAKEYGIIDQVIKLSDIADLTKAAPPAAQTEAEAAPAPAPAPAATPREDEGPPEPKQV